MICLVEKRDTGKNLEKYYRAIALNFIVRPEADQGQNKKALALSILRDNLSVAIKTVKDDKQSVIALIGSVKLTPEDISKFNKRLNEVMREFRACHSSDGRSYTLNLSLYPNDINTPEQPAAELNL